MVAETIKPNYQLTDPRIGVLFERLCTYRAVLMDSKIMIIWWFVFNAPYDHIGCFPDWDWRKKRLGAWNTISPYIAAILVNKQAAAEGWKHSWYSFVLGRYFICVTGIEWGACLDSSMKLASTERYLAMTYLGSDLPDKEPSTDPIPWHWSLVVRI